MTTHAKSRAPALGAAFGALGAAALAVAASLCCVGPAVVALLGTGGALAVAGLEPYRLYLLGGGALLLAFAFYFAYRPGGSCRNGTCSKGVSRFVRFSLWLSAAALLGAFLLPYFVY